MQRTRTGLLYSQTQPDSYELATGTGNSSLVTVLGPSPASTPSKRELEVKMQHVDARTGLPLPNSTARVIESKPLFSESSLTRLNSSRGLVLLSLDDSGAYREPLLISSMAVWPPGQEGGEAGKQVGALPLLSRFPVGVAVLASSTMILSQYLEHAGLTGERGYTVYRTRNAYRITACRVESNPAQGAS